MMTKPRPVKALTLGRNYLLCLPLTFGPEGSLSASWALIRVNKFETVRGKPMLTIWNYLTRKASTFQVDDSLLAYESMEEAGRRCFDDIRVIAGKYLENE